MRRPLWWLAACVLLVSGVSSHAQSLRRVAFLPFEADEASDQWLGHLVSDLANRALATNTLADVPEAAEWARGRLKMRMSYVDSAVRDPAAACEVLDLDFVVRGWARRDGDTGVFDVELMETASGSRILAQSFRSPVSDLAEAALAMASRCSEAIYGAPLLAYARQVVRPVAVRADVLEAYGRGLASLDAAAEAGARGDVRTQSRELVAASNYLAQVVNAQPELLWPYDALMEASNAIIELDPTVAAAYVNIGIAEGALGNIQGAVAILRQGRRMAREDPTVRVALANFLLDLAARSGIRRQELLEEAQLAAREATNLAPQDPSAWAMLGAAAYDAASYEAAAEAYGRASELDPFDAVPRLGLGLSLVRLGLWEDARPHLEAVLELDPAGSMGRRARTELERMAVP